MSQAGSRQAWQLDCGSKDDPALATLVITKPLAGITITPPPPPSPHHHHFNIRGFALMVCNMTNPCQDKRELLGLLLTSSRLQHSNRKQIKLDRTFSKTTMTLSV